jgi:hypothetical protein
LVGVAVLFGIGAAYSLLRKPGPTPAPPSPPPAASVVPPAQLRGLAYLPADANVVFAVQAGPVIDHARRTNQNPVELLTKVGVPAAALAALGRGGVALPAIDHVAGGAVIGDKDLGFAVALVLNQPVPDEGKFLDALKARRPAEGNPPHHVVEFAGLPFALKLAKKSDTVWLLGWTEPDLTPAGNGLSDRMRSAATEAFSADTAAWLLTDSADWAAKQSVSLLLTLGKKQDWQPGLAKVRAVAAGLTYADEPTLRVMAKGATPAARDELRAALARQTGTTGETGGWVFLDAPADRAGGLAALRAVLAPPK